MKTKLILIFVGLVIVAGGFYLFADNQNGNACGKGYIDVSEKQEIEITGEVTYDAQSHPVLTGRGKKYKLMLSPYYLFQLNIKSNDTILLKGYEIEDMDCDCGCDEDTDEELTHFLATKILVNGMEFIVRNGFGCGRGGYKGGCGDCR